MYTLKFQFEGSKNQWEENFNSYEKLTDFLNTLKHFLSKYEIIQN